MEELVAIVDESGNVEVYKRIQVAPDVIEYQKVPCAVFMPPSPNNRLTWIGASIAVAAWTIQFGVSKFYELLLGWIV